MPGAGLGGSEYRLRWREGRAAHRTAADGRDASLEGTTGTARLPRLKSRQPWKASPGLRSHWKASPGLRSQPLWWSLRAREEATPDGEQSGGRGGQAALPPGGARRRPGGQSEPGRGRAVRSSFPVPPRRPGPPPHPHPSARLGGRATRVPRPARPRSASPRPRALGRARPGSSSKGRAGRRRPSPRLV